MTLARPALVAAVLMATLGACASGEDDSVTQLDESKWGDGVEQTSVEHMVERIPALEGIADVTYYGGGLGAVPDRSVPGPTEHWIDAVVTLPEGGGATLVEYVEDEARSLDEPPVVYLLDPHVPDADWWISAELNDQFSENGWRAEVYVSVEHDQLVLMLTEQ